MVVVIYLDTLLKHFQLDRMDEMLKMIKLLYEDFVDAGVNPGQEVLIMPMLKRLTVTTVMALKKLARKLRIQIILGTRLIGVICIMKISFLL